MYIPLQPSNLTGPASQQHNLHPGMEDQGRREKFLSDPSATCSKKRKRTLETLDLQSSLSSSQSDPPSPWPILSPTLLSPTDPLSNYHQPSLLSGTTSLTSKRRRLPLAPKPRFRPPSTPTISSTNSTSQPPNLAPCHICHRRPTAHADLPSYSSCESCERRTCFICMRVCEGAGCRSSASTNITMTTARGAENEYDYHYPQQRQQQSWDSFPSKECGYGRQDTAGMEFAVKGKSICGKCCVEVGVEGKVWCLVCFEDDADDGGDRGGESDGEEGSGTGRVEEWLDRCDELEAEKGC